ncbi:hypothetical protein GCM10007874_00160 [Labrys miyagiensis]|uniref:Uncharacterized protein n=1 Tax=Labrys miyagiensis TaxID=346912 RepID=A0ABQ6CFD3_9HYPH|nr:hypothetical protein GCM10007874_00160 [Labrys miyagiensis]
MQPGIVIIGAGEAGARAVFALRENGWSGAVSGRSGSRERSAVSRRSEPASPGKACLVEHADPTHRVMGSQTVSFEVPARN